MKPLKYSHRKTDKPSMKVLAFLFLLPLLAVADDGEDSSGTSSAGDCPAASYLQKQIDLYSGKASDQNLTPEARASYDKQATDLQSQKIGAEAACQSKANGSDTSSKKKKSRDELSDDEKREKAKCDNNKETYKWDNYSKTCEPRKVARGEGECSDAEMLKGTNLRGEACKAAANTIKDVRAQQESITATTQAAATAYSSMQAMQATGQQGDAQQRQQKVLQALALSKIASGGVQLAGAAQLKSAAGEAETASSGISGVAEAINSECKARNTNDEFDDEQCFNQVAKEHNIPDTALDYSTYQRMRNGASQSQDQANAANNMAKASMITGAADMFVGLQALALSRKAQQNAQALAPPVAPPPSYRFAGNGRSGGFSGGVVPGDSPAGPTDFGVPGGDGGGGLAVAGGAPSNSIKAGGGYASSGGFKSGKSVVSQAGKAGGGGGGGGAGGKGADGKQGKPKTNTTAGEYTLGGGSLGGGKGGKGGGKSDSGGNAFADALAKLFPQDKDGKPVVDSRQIASLDAPVEATDAVVGSEVYAADISIFDQISTKYRQLAGAGRL